MRQLIFGLLSILILSPKPLAADSIKAKNTTIDGMMLQHGATIYVYKVYAATCNELEPKLSDSTIILSPGDPIEISYKNKGSKNILILYSLPCK